MRGLDYETVARFAQQGGTLYFIAIFVAGLVYAWWPSSKAAFDRAALIPLQDDEIDHG